MTTELKPLTVSPATAAELLDCSRDFVYKAIRQGHLPTIKAGALVRIPYQDLLDYIEANRRAS